MIQVLGRYGQCESSRGGSAPGGRRRGPADLRWCHRRPGCGCDRRPVRAAPGPGVLLGATGVGARGRGVAARSAGCAARTGCGVRPAGADGHWAVGGGTRVAGYARPEGVRADSGLRGRPRRPRRRREQRARDRQRSAAHGPRRGRPGRAPGRTARPGGCTPTPGGSRSRTGRTEHRSTDRNIRHRAPGTGRPARLPRAHSRGRRTAPRSGARRAGPRRERRCRRVGPWRSRTACRGRRWGDVRRGPGARSAPRPPGGRVRRGGRRRRCPRRRGGPRR